MIRQFFLYLFSVALCRGWFASYLAHYFAGNSQQLMPVFGRIIGMVVKMVVLMVMSMIQEMSERMQPFQQGGLESRCNVKKQEAGRQGRVIFFQKHEHTPWLN